MIINCNQQKLSRGFSLVEMAIVLIILGFVLGALLLPMQAQRNQLLQSQTENTLETAKKALLGYAQSQGRLPCPATNNGTGVFPDDNGVSNLPVGGACAQPLGFLPAVTLGILPVNSNGFAIDAWGNPIRYSVTASNANAFTTASGMSAIGISGLNPDIRVCATATAANCTATINLANNAVAIIYSLGQTGLVSGGLDEDQNLDGDTIFVSHNPESNGVNGEFDHMVIWISPYVLYNSMIEAGQLH